MENGEIIIYQNNEGDIKPDVRLEDETVWLSQAQLVLLRRCQRETKLTIRNFRIVQNKYF